jgi:hypothetical protein
MMGYGKGHGFKMINQDYCLSKKKSNVIQS